MKILSNKILLKPVKSENKLGLEEVSHYEVTEIGPKVEEVKKGDKVLFMQAPKVTIMGEEYHLAEVDDLICIL